MGFSTLIGTFILGVKKARLLQNSRLKMRDTTGCGGASNHPAATQHRGRLRLSPMRMGHLWQRKEGRKYVTLCPVATAQCSATRYHRAPPRSGVLNHTHTKSPRREVPDAGALVDSYPKQGCILV